MTEGPIEPAKPVVPGRSSRLASSALALAVASLATASLFSRGSSSNGFYFLLAGLIGGNVAVGLGIWAAVRRGSPARAWTAILLGLLIWPVSFVLALSAMGAPGRPMRVWGVRILPRVRRRRRTAAATEPSCVAGEPDVASVPSATRTTLAELWLADARAEHASVPAFEHLADDLAVAGAPEHLGAWARRAALEEVSHAALCFAIARAYAGCTFRASRLVFPRGWLRHRGSRRGLVKRLAVESLFDGCIEEGTAARSAEEAAREAEDPAIRRALECIARDEARHAELARAIVEWAVSVEPSLREALIAKLEALMARLSREVESTPPRVDLARYGRLDSSRLLALKLDASRKALRESRDWGMRANDRGVL
jgi:hypothetical protein